MLLAEGCEPKEFKELPWNFCELSVIKEAFCIKGIAPFITNENFYYACFDLPNELIAKIKNYQL